MAGRHWIIIGVVILVILLTIFFVNHNQSKKAVMVTISHPTATVTASPTAGQSATITPLETEKPTAGPTVVHVIVTATPEQSTLKPTEESTPTPNP